ncbi:methanol O-anthraniloyltransferase-like [Olea europaea var. sylvestris]|uniref:methanol O-anthraniloyltransferase-like n=1 Tax=Olea europaea var. sylvestris TaxID=158386 RepID=UPI000C1CCFCF|nr:methanol O-anthraniloyltransferase-like [Olea europaea var. sylvestris]
MAFSSNFAFSVNRCKPELVVPAKPTPREIKKLSDIDDQEGFRFQVPIMFFYKNNPSMKGINPAEVIREGLAKTLVYYYPFAGRIMEGDNRKLMVDCNGEGVLFVEADACIMLEQLGDNILPPCPLMEEFLHDVPGTGGIIGCPLLLIQVTRFICGGFALGIRMNHTMADGYGMMQFLSSISELMKGASAPSISPVWQREQYLNARSPARITCIHHEYEQIPQSTDFMDSDKLFRTAIFFTPKVIQALYNHLSLSGSSQRCSRFDLIIACLWKCRTNTLNPSDQDLYGGVASATSNISFCTNFKNSKGEDGVVVPICLPPLAVEKFKYELEKITCEPLCRISVLVLNTLLYKNCFFNHLFNIGLTNDVMGLENRIVVVLHQSPLLEGKLVLEFCVCKENSSGGKYS